MDRNLKNLDWDWDNNISMSSCLGLKICRHAEPSIHEKEVNKAADHSRQISSLHADDYSGYSLEHGSVVKDKEHYIGKEKGIEKNPTAGRPGKWLIGLNLYPSNNETVSNYPVFPLSSTTTKRYRGSHHLMQNPFCQVEGCNMDLTSAKEYHRRHRICEAHSKTPMVIVAGMQHRFCQQCSRLYDLSEFDDEKRNCRRQLSDHNAMHRRQPEGNHFSSTGRPYSFHDRQSRTSNCLSGSSMSTSNSMGKSSCRLKTRKDPSPTSTEQLMHESVTKAQQCVHSVTPNCQQVSSQNFPAEQVPFYSPNGFNGSA